LAADERDADLRSSVFIGGHFFWFKEPAESRLPAKLPAPQKQNAPARDRRAYSDY
jgi:hypothetical protein